MNIFEALFGPNLNNNQKNALSIAKNNLDRELYLLGENYIQASKDFHPLDDSLGKSFCFRQMDIYNAYSGLCNEIIYNPKFTQDLRKEEGL